MSNAATTSSDLRDALNYRAIPNNTKSSWWLDPSLRWNMLHCVGLCGTLFFNGYDGSLFNGLQSINQWQSYFGHPSSNILGLMNSAGFLPGFIASFFSDRVGHYLGRRATVWLGTVITMVGIILISLSTSVGMFCTGRAIMGFGTSTALTMAPSLLQEIAHPRLRAQIGGFYTCVYYIAAIFSAALCLGCLDLPGESAWRIPCWVQIVGPGLTLVLTATMPESPRWLVKHGKIEKAKAVLVKYHANGTEDDPLVEYEYREILAALEDESANHETRYTDYLRGAGNRHRLMIIVVVAVGTNWVGNGIISYYLNPILNTLGISDTRTQLEILVGLQIWNLIISTTAALCVEKAGRRPLWLGSTAGMLVSMIMVLALSGAYAQGGVNIAGVAVIPFLFLFYGSYDLAWTPLAYSYPVEILPFSLRTKGQAIYIALQTLAVSVNTWVNPVALDAIEWKYYAVYVAILGVLMFIIYFGFPETKNLTIEEISLVFNRGHAVGRVGREEAGDSAKLTAVGSVREDHVVKD